MTDLFGDETPATEGGQRRDRRSQSGSGGPGRRRRRSWASFVVMLVILGGLTFLGARVIPPLFDTGPEPVAQITDFPGPGQGEVIIEVAEGATGAQIGQTLKDAGVVATVDAFSAAFTANVQSPSIQPGSYKLPLEMKASDAVAALLDPNRRADTRITIPEGWRSDQIYQRVADSFGVPVAEVDAAAHDYAAFGLEGAPNTNPDAIDPMEGFFYPDTYVAPPGSGPADVLKQMFDRSIAELDALGVAPENRVHVLTVGSIAMREINDPDLYPRVARVVENRLVPGNATGATLLGMDSTLRYAWDRLNPGQGAIPGEAHSNAQHPFYSNPYNTRAATGLPPGPIGAVDALAMGAALNPEEGDWTYFVTVDLCSGETIFTSSQAEHDVYVEQFREWNREYTANGSQC